MSELFPVVESLSPKLAWLKKHGLTTKHDPELESCPESPETGDTCYPWVCGALDGRTEPYGVGMTEEEACIDYAQKNDVRHWTVEIIT